MSGRMLESGSSDEKKMVLHGPGLRLCLLALLPALLFVPSKHAWAETSTEEMACEPHADLAAQLKRLPAELRLFDSRLRIVNIYKRQAEIMLDADIDDAEAVRRWLAEIYPAHRDFWAGYVGDEQAFTEFSQDLMRYRKRLLCKHIPKLLALDLDERFERHARWLEQATGKAPVGTWYLAYGSGATDMGGIGSIGMVIDFSNQVAEPASIEALLPHELAHQVHGLRRDPDSDTVLGRMLAEGLATYVACVRAEGRFSAAECIGYDDAQWRWAIEHEAALRAFVKPILHSRARADSDAVASRNIVPIEGGPTAIGYFLGHRIVQAYTERHGHDAWKDLLDMPVKRVLRKSGYSL
ncbi:MAG: hypothetical protein E6Q88_12415 [Lysobacteraceae bacterium]|nr:MAG: hypothetical protein E6Q88_12415 [Xanthomonadaceae bacterium]